MTWSQLFGSDSIPSNEDIIKFIGLSDHLWNNLVSHIEEKYKVQPKIEYSKCSAQPGWNIKYKKSGKSLCTLYPMPDYFIALVVVGAKEEEEVKMAIESGIFTPYTKELYNKTAFSLGGRWLMIEVKDNAVINDIKALIAIRVSGSKQK